VGDHSINANFIPYRANHSRSFDVSPPRRRDEPDFYGYIPDAASSRTLIFGCMIINGALLLLVRSVSMALLAMVGGPWVLVYLMSDMGLYFVYKILRRDLWHWIPLETAASVVESVLERLVVKVLVDFTGVIQFRGAAEMGGCYFTFKTVRAGDKTDEHISSLANNAHRSWRSLPRSLPLTSITRASRMERRGS
jgi:hypothetical protein